MQRLDPGATVLLVIDVQERLAAAMPEGARARLLKNTGILLGAAKVLGVRALATEQYPKGLGPTLPELATPLAEVGPAPLAKLTFDACSELRFGVALAELAPRSIILTGMEAHVCVYQTARELVRRGYDTWVAADAVTSRREEDRTLGLALCERAGALVAPTETIVFDWLGAAGTDAFRAVSKLLK